MTLHAALRVQRAGFRLSLDLTVEPGEVVALLGPNGAGKTTALRALAGLEAGGAISVNGSTWDGLPAEKRPVGVVFQDYLLFAHMSVLDNVAFGLRARGTRKAEANAIALRWLHQVGLTEFARAKPRTLSGGQAQRVALARALATSPQLLLLDEPLAALDASTRLRVRSELGRHLIDYPGHTLLVTHDPLDAMVLADRLVILENGRVVQQGAPRDVVRQPQTDYVAHLVGLNFYRGVADGTEVRLDDGGTLTIAEPAEGPVHVVFPPSAVSLFPSKPAGSPRNTWQAVVSGIEQHAHTTRVDLDGSPAVLADVTTATVAELRLQPGDSLWVSLKATEIHTYPR
ncbi:ABC transporter ATP-binding protein [Lentzea flava]|uniref:ABC transporter ATP-binding protein n=1 Tax=Lentzea flava TaxID=103732 RepID=A0ABQ2UJP0_9PSEU|nr:ABC transporter ATP-binding protein [Lentzea flava]MCP2200294.1 molybdate transport system ATP-binding protein [Lentzea flava]GGU41303.1 ABC transporter ATP-binding protein [Lentzea flava]